MTVTKINNLSELPRVYNKKGKKRPWKPEELEALTKLHKQGIGQRKIAKKINRKEASVRTKLSSLGLLKSLPVKGRGKEFGAEALIQTQAVLKALGYKLVVTKLT